MMAKDLGLVNSEEYIMLPEQMTRGDSLMHCSLCETLV